MAADQNELERESRIRILFEPRIVKALSRSFDYGLVLIRTGFSIYGLAILSLPLLATLDPTIGAATIELAAKFFLVAFILVVSAGYFGHLSWGRVGLAYEAGERSMLAGIRAGTTAGDSAEQSDVADREADVSEKHRRMSSIHLAVSHLLGIASLFAFALGVQSLVAP